MRKRTAGCLGSVFGAATVVWATVHFVNADMEKMEEMKAKALARAYYEGPSQVEYDARCAGEKRHLDETRTRECDRMEFFMKKASERKAREALGGRQQEVGH